MQSGSGTLRGGMDDPSYILTVRCRDAVGIVAAVSSALADGGAFITESSHYGDPDTGLFFMRTVFRPTSGIREAEAKRQPSRSSPVTGNSTMRTDACG